MGDPKITIINGLPINDLNGDGVFRSSDGDSILLRDARSCSCREASKFDGEDERKYLFDYLSITKLEGVRIESLKRYAETVSAIKINAGYGLCAYMESFIRELSRIAKEANIEGSDVTKAIQSIDTAGCYKNGLDNIRKGAEKALKEKNIPERTLNNYIKTIKKYLQKAGGSKQGDDILPLLEKLEARQRNIDGGKIKAARGFLSRISNTVEKQEKAGPFAQALNDRILLQLVGRIITSYIKKADLSSATVTWEKNSDSPYSRELFIETANRKFKIAIVKMENGYSHRAFHIRKMPQTEGPPAKRRLSF